jgi:hypothetical protein
MKAASFSALTFFTLTRLASFGVVAILGLRTRLISLFLCLLIHLKLQMYASMLYSIFFM